MKKPIKSFIIDRSRWLNGSTIRKLNMGMSRLLGNNNTMCCMGFLAEACGIRLKPGQFDFESLTPAQHRKLPRLFRLADDALDGDAYAINDSPTIRGPAREKRLAALCAKAGIKVRFVGKAPK